VPLLKRGNAPRIEPDVSAAIVTSDPLSIATCPLYLSNYS
jgi:hypothetical protein